MQYPKISLLAAALAAVCAAPSVYASSHREAPFVAGHPQVDATDWYAFNSYEPGRAGFVTLIADYIPLQDTFGGPNYFALDPNALYEMEIDNNGDGVEDITFQFRFTNTYANAPLTIGGKQVPVPLELLGAVGPGVTDGDANKNLVESYTVTIVRGDRRTGTAQAITNAADSSTTFRKPLDNIGNKSIPNYAAYANNHVFNINIPGCDAGGKVFVGQRADPFFVNLGEIFDLVNLNPVGAPNAEPNSLQKKAITALELEVPATCLTTAGNPIIGSYTTASLRQAAVLNPKPAGVIAGAGGKGPEVVGGAWTQVSRLGMALVNEVVIGLPDKDRFNSSDPKDDAQFADYVTNPTLPALLEILFSVPAPQVFPRTDLVAAFLTGVQGLNQPTGVVPSEMLRLNTSIPAVAAANQKTLGVLDGDTAGYPNGRRPGDDVTDISLRVAMGVLLPAAQQTSASTLPLTDQTSATATDFGTAFPYLNPPLPGSPNGANGVTAVAAAR